MYFDFEEAMNSGDAKAKNCESKIVQYEFINGNYLFLISRSVTVFKISPYKKKY